MRRILIPLSVLFTVILSLNFIIGTVNTPQGMVFLSTVHYPTDYFYYVSQFALGQTRWITSVDLYTPEKIAPSLIGMTNVMTGRMLSIFGVNPVIAYEIALTLFTLLFFLAAMRVLEHVFPKDVRAGVITFIFLCIANMFPGAPSFFNNIAEPDIRFPRVPHQMLGLVCILLPVIVIVALESGKLPKVRRAVDWILLCVSGFLLANINPVQWALVSCVLFAGSVWQYVRGFRTPSNRMNFRPFLYPAAFAFAGAPMTVYLSHAMKSLPFSQLASWESYQQVRLTVMSFVQSFGPVMLITLFGLPLFLKRLTLPRVYMLTYFAASILLFLSPIPQMANISNTRFLSAVTVFGGYILAANFLTGIPIKKRVIKNTVVWAIVLIITLVSIPMFIEQFKTHANLNTSNSYIYTTVPVYEAFRETKNRTTMQDVVLVTWPFDASFPALTGRHGYMGHPLLTINSDAKNKNAYYFFDAKVSDDQMHTFLKDNGITYVLSFTSVTKIEKPFMKLVYQNQTLTLYNVLP